MQVKAGMWYKTISTVVTDAASNATALAAAAAIARREGAHLDVHCVAVYNLMIDASPMGAPTVLLDNPTAQAAALASKLMDWARKALPADLTQVSLQSVIIAAEGMDAVVARTIRYADLIVLTQPYGKGRSQLLVEVAETALFGTDAPVLVVPEGPTDYDQPFRHAVVAWNSGAEALSAIRKALPLLQAAEQVDIVIIDPPKHSAESADPGGSICRMLSRHGVSAEVSILAQTLPRVSDVILRHASEHGADIIVMGAYGHSRLREAIFGGATREMLELSTLPVLMAH